MKVLFVHQNFPAQFGRLAMWLTSRGHQTVFLTGREDVSLSGVHKVLFKETRETGKQTHRYIKPIEKAVLQGQAAVRSAIHLKNSGFIPDVIVGHSGFGATLYMNEVYPNTPFVGYFEWYYRPHGADSDFEEKSISLDDACRVATRNMAILPDLVSCVSGITPTYWQHQQFPQEYSCKIDVLHDGIDTEYFSPLPITERNKEFCISSCGLRLSGSDEIITYVARGMEPYRGFPQFMEAAYILQKQRPKCHIVVVGTDRVAYGAPHQSGKSYKTIMLEKYKFDSNRLHFTGPLSYAEYRQVLQHSSVHVYLTYPFILSWSFLEALSCGCSVVASDTSPVKEVINHEENGILIPFSDTTQLVSRIVELLDDKEKRTYISENARLSIVSKYAISRIFPLYESLLKRVAATYL